MTKREAVFRATEAFRKADVDVESCRLNYYRHVDQGDNVVGTVGAWTRPPAEHQLVALAILFADRSVRVLGGAGHGLEDAAA